MTPQELQALQTAIHENPACAAYIVTNEDPKDPDYMVKDQAIADIISEGRVKYQPRLVTTRGIRAAMTVEEAYAFISLMRSLNESTEIPSWLSSLLTTINVPEQSHPAYFDAFHEAFDWLRAGGEGIDVGDPTTRQMMDLLVAADPSKWASPVAKLKKLAEVPDPVTAAEVSRALRGPHGDEN